MSKERLETFSDGVFAVALTLLILGLHVPYIANHSSLANYEKAMMPLVPNVVSFALAFIIISIHWVSHHYFFRQLKSAPIGLVWLNNIFLLLLCFMPFPTVLLGQHPTDQFPIILFALNQLLASIIFFGFRKYAFKKKLFIDGTSEKALGPRHSIPAITLYSLSIIFAFVNVYVALICLFFVPVLYFIPTLIEHK